MDFKEFLDEGQLDPPMVMDAIQNGHTALLQAIRSLESATGKHASPAVKKKAKASIKLAKEAMSGLK